MGEIRVDVTAGSTWSGLPPLSDIQRKIVDIARERNAVVRGAPGSGRTTTALSILADATNRGLNAMLLVPDRVRGDVLMPAVQALLPDSVRPVRTPAAFAYHIVSAWRTARAYPLGSVELVTGAAEDQLLTELLETRPAPWPDSIPEDMRAMPSFRMEMRNLFARAGEAGCSGEDLVEWGQRFHHPEWEAAGELLSAWTHAEGFDVESLGAMRVDLARIQHVAADLIEHWDERGAALQVESAPPLPDVLVVDDLQDCTASTVRLLEQVACLGGRVVAFSDPDVAIASYRGGEPHLDIRLACALGVDVDDLGEVHRGTPQLRELYTRVAAGIPQTGSLQRRRVGLASCLDDSQKLSVTDSLHVHLAATSAQLGALVARGLRSHFLHEDIPWTEQVVIARSASAVAEIRRYLRRAGIPLNSGRRAFAFASEPLTRTLLQFVAPEDERTEEDVSALMESPLFAVDPLELHQEIRRLRQATGNPICTLLDLLNAVNDSDIQTQVRGGRERKLDALLTRAARFLAESVGVWALRPQEALWKLWAAADVADRWRAISLAGGTDAEYYDDLLDSMLALFRVADIWEQRYPNGTALDFVRQLMADDVPQDTLVRTGIRPGGVEVLTPSQAVGREWDVVYILGLQDGGWPNVRLRDRVLRADLVAEIGRGTLAESADGTPVLVDDPRESRRAVLADEMRLYASALSRARSHVHLGAVRAEERAPSQFLDPAIDILQLPVVDGHIECEEVQPPLDMHGHIAALRYHAARADKPEERDIATTLLALLLREGVPEASPLRWSGGGGITSDSDILGDATVTLTPSRFEEAQSCILKWFLGASGGSPGAGDAQSLGTLVHSIAEHHPQGSRADMLDELHQQVDLLGYDLTTWSGRESLAHAEEVVEALADYIESVPPSVQVEVEQRLDVQVDQVAIYGYIDRLERTDEGVSIIDFKTGKHGTKTPKEVPDHPQLALYQVGMLEQGEKVRGAELKFLGNGDVRTQFQKPLEGETLDMWKKRIHDVAQKMKGPTYAATPSETACRYCTFQRVCPAREEGRRTIE